MKYLILLIAPLLCMGAASVNNTNVVPNLSVLTNVYVGGFASLSGQTNRLTVASGQLKLDGTPLISNTIWTNVSQVVSLTTFNPSPFQIYPNGGMLIGSNTLAYWGALGGETIVSYHDTAMGDPDRNEIYIETRDSNLNVDTSFDVTCRTNRFLMDIDNAATAGNLTLRLSDNPSLDVIELTSAGVLVFSASPAGLLTGNPSGGSAVPWKIGSYTSTNNLQVEVNGTNFWIASDFGVTDASSAAAGEKGQIISSAVASGSAVSLTTATPANITSISLTAGDWDVEGNINFTRTGATITATAGGISTTTATLPTDGTQVHTGTLTTTANLTDGLTLPRKRISISGTTTVYLVASTSFSAGTSAGFGSISARRVR